MPNRQNQILASETHNKRVTRLEQYKQNRSVQSSLPLFKQPAFCKRMHKTMQSITDSSCTTCMGKFPGVIVAATITEYARCKRDKSSPKIYSQDNNMHPGMVPQQLKVQTQKVC